MYFLRQSISRTLSWATPLYKSFTPSSEFHSRIRTAFRRSRHCQAATPASVRGCSQTKPLFLFGSEITSHSFLSRRSVASPFITLRAMMGCCTLHVLRMLHARQPITALSGRSQTRGILIVRIGTGKYKKVRRATLRPSVSLDTPFYTRPKHFTARSAFRVGWRWWWLSSVGKPQCLFAILRPYALCRVP